MKGIVKDAILITAFVLSMTVGVKAACLGPYCWEGNDFSVNFPLKSYTLAVATSTVWPLGTQMMVSNAGVSNTLCVSTGGVAINNVVHSTNTAAVCH